MSPWINAPNLDVKSVSHSAVSNMTVWHGFYVKVRPPSELDITINSCAWEAAEAGGPVELNVSFTVLNNAQESLFATYLVRDSTNPGLFYKPSGFDSSLTVYTGETGERTLRTDKFPVGSETLQLVIAGQRRTTENVPLNQCVQP